MGDAFTLYVKINAELPDFRLFASFLWSENHSTDSDGDSHNPASRTWSYLYMASRELENQNFEILRSSEQSLECEVISQNELIAKRVAYFLARETNGKISDGKNVYSLENFTHELGSDFNLKTALESSDKSVWRKSTLDNPYPNLKG